MEGKSDGKNQAPLCNVCFFEKATIHRRKRSNSTRESELLTKLTCDSDIEEDDDESVEDDATSGDEQSSDKSQPVDMSSRLRRKDGQSFQYFSMDIKHNPETSLTNITKKFVRVFSELMYTNPLTPINVKYVLSSLDVPWKRLHKVLEVLEALDIISSTSTAHRTSKTSSYIWKGRHNLPNTLDPSLTPSDMDKTINVKLLTRHLHSLLSTTTTTEAFYSIKTITESLISTMPAYSNYHSIIKKHNLSHSASRHQVVTVSGVLTMVNKRLLERVGEVVCIFEGAGVVVGTARKFQFNGSSTKEEEDDDSQVAVDEYESDVNIGEKRKRMNFLSEIVFENMRQELTFKSNT